MGVRRISVLDRRELTYNVGAFMGGVPWQPGVGTTVSAAFMTTRTDPVDADWVPGTFDTTNIGTVVGLVMVGPAPGHPLPVGTYYEWCKVDDPPTGSRPVECVGTLIVM